MGHHASELASRTGSLIEFKPPSPLRRSMICCGYVETSNLGAFRIWFVKVQYRLLNRRAGALSHASEPNVGYCGSSGVVPSCMLVDKLTRRLSYMIY